MHLVIWEICSEREYWEGVVDERLGRLRLATHASLCYSDLHCWIVAWSHLRVIVRNRTKYKNLPLNPTRSLGPLYIEFHSNWF